MTAIINPKKYPEFDPLVGVVDPNDILVLWRTATGRNLSITFQQLLDQLGGGGASNLGDLSDVTLVSLTNGQALVYDSVSATWKNKSLGVSDVSGLSTLLDNKVSKWEAWNADLTVLGVAYADNFVFSGVDPETGAGGAALWGLILGDITDQADLMTALLEATKISNAIVDADLIFEIIESGKSKGVVFEGVTDKFSIYVEEDGLEGAGPSDPKERSTWVFEFGDNDDAIPSIEDRILFRHLAIDGITKTDILEMRQGYANFKAPLLKDNRPIPELPVASAGSVISFDRTRTFGTKVSPITSAGLTEDNTDLTEVTQVIFHQAASLSVPVTWSKDVGSADYDPAKVAIIYVEAFSPTYKRYLITYDD